MHDAYTIGIPVLAILIANLINRSDLKALKAEMNAKFDKMNAEMNSRFEKMNSDLNARFDKVDRRFDAIDVELRYFHGVTGMLDGRLSALEKR